MRSDGGRRRRAGQRERSNADNGTRRAILLCGLALPFLAGLYVLVLVPWARLESGGRRLAIDLVLGDLLMLLDDESLEGERLERTLAGTKGKAGEDQGAAGLSLVS